eukprot:TRINITY_DN8093_c0_g2_i1.p1 TRINITY_DN8093_c0_g2~~TRINITY_DN8093_c0_g2_i1.p1  ORF type:complete len:622 (+),score=62.29 TRINITY_DN8093_c0_g2_i1:284-2149(+)
MASDVVRNYPARLFRQRVSLLKLSAAVFLGSPSNGDFGLSRTSCSPRYNLSSVVRHDESGALQDEGRCQVASSDSSAREDEGGGLLAVVRAARKHAVRVQRPLMASDGPQDGYSHISTGFRRDEDGVTSSSLERESKLPANRIASGSSRKVDLGYRSGPFQSRYAEDANGGEEGDRWQHEGRQGRRGEEMDWNGASKLKKPKGWEESEEQRDFQYNSGQSIHSGADSLERNRDKRSSSGLNASGMMRNSDFERSHALGAGRSANFSSGNSLTSERQRNERMAYPLSSSRQLPSSTRLPMAPLMSKPQTTSGGVSTPPRVLVPRLSPGDRKFKAWNKEHGASLPPLEDLQIPQALNPWKPKPPREEVWRRRVVREKQKKILEMEEHPSFEDYLAREADEEGWKRRKLAFLVNQILTMKPNPAMKVLNAQRSWIRWEDAEWLIDDLLGKGEVIAALRVLKWNRQLPGFARTLGAYTKLFDAFLHLNHLSLAREVFELTVADGFVPSDSTYAALIVAFARIGCDPLRNNVAWTTYEQMEEGAKRRLPESVRQLLFKALRRHDENEKCVETLLEDMRHADMAWSSEMYTWQCKLASKRGDSDKLKSLHDEMRVQGFDVPQGKLMA